MEFLRFGSSIPGSYWGCCAVCIIQNFKVEPDAKASIQLVSGDGGGPITDNDGNMLFAGPTYRDIFNQRIRSGTFEKRDMPNHGFLAILTEGQINGSIGKKWLEILKETGFEFIRTVSNSVYEGQTLLSGEPTDGSQNHIFGLFRNIGAGAIRDPFTPPKAWMDLPSVTPEIWPSVFAANGLLSGEVLADQQRESQLSIWNKIGPPKFLTEDEVGAAGAPVVLAGLRSQYPQQLKATRESLRQAEKAAKVKPEKPAVSDPFSLNKAEAIEALDAA